MLTYSIFRWKRFQFLWNGSKIKNKGLSTTDTSIQDYENMFNDLKRLLLYFSSMSLQKQIQCVKYVLLFEVRYLYCMY